MDVVGLSAEADSPYKLPIPTAEQLVSDVTPSAVLNAFHRYRLKSVTDSGLQSNLALTVTAAASRTRCVMKERKDSSVVKKPG